MPHPRRALHGDRKVKNINLFIFFFLLRFSICSSTVIIVLKFLDVTSKKWLLVLAKVQRERRGAELKMRRLLY